MTRAYVLCLAALLICPPAGAQATSRPSLNDIRNYVLANPRFQYYWGRDSARDMVLLPNGRIGEGAGHLEHQWTVENVDGVPAIVLSGVGRAALYPMPDGSFAGKWPQGEIWWVELRPLGLPFKPGLRATPAIGVSGQAAQSPGAADGSDQMFFTQSGWLYAVILFVVIGAVTIVVNIKETIRKRKQN